jgi:hypothetical protein
MEGRLSRKHPLPPSMMNTLSYSEISPPGTNQINRVSEIDDLEFRTAQLHALIASGSSPAIDFLERITHPNSPAERNKHLDSRQGYNQKEYSEAVTQRVRESIPSGYRYQQRHIDQTSREDSPRITEIRHRYGLPPRQRRSLTIRRSSIGRALEQARNYDVDEAENYPPAVHSNHSRYQEQGTSDRSSQIRSKRCIQYPNSPEPELPESKPVTTVKLVAEKWEFDQQKNKIKYQPMKNSRMWRMSEVQEEKLSDRTSKSLQKPSIPTEALNAALHQVLSNMGIPMLAKVTVVEKEVPKPTRLNITPQDVIETPCKASKLVRNMPVEAMTPSTRSAQKLRSSIQVSEESQNIHPNIPVVRTTKKEDHSNKLWDPRKEKGDLKLKQRLTAINLAPNTRLFGTITKSPSVQRINLNSNMQSGNTDSRILREMKQALQSTMSDEENFYINSDPKPFKNIQDRRSAINLFGESDVTGTVTSDYEDSRRNIRPTGCEKRAINCSQFMECYSRKGEMYPSSSLQSSLHAQQSAGLRSPWKDLAKAAPGGRSIRYLGRGN